MIPSQGRALNRHANSDRAADTNPSRGSQAKTILDYTVLTIGLFLGAVRDRIHRCVVVKDHRGTWL